MTHSDGFFFNLLRHFLATASLLLQSLGSNACLGVRLKVFRLRLSFTSVCIVLRVMSNSRARPLVIVFPFFSLTMALTASTAFGVLTSLPLVRLGALGVSLATVLYTVARDTPKSWWIWVGVLPWADRARIAVLVCSWFMALMFMDLQNVCRFCLQFALWNRIDTMIGQFTEEWSAWHVLALNSKVYHFKPVTLYLVASFDLHNEFFTRVGYWIRQPRPWNRGLLLWEGRPWRRVPPPQYLGSWQCLSQHELELGNQRA